MRVRALSILLIAWRLSAAVPTPQSHFGHEIGADRTVLDWDRVVSYFQALEKRTARAFACRSSARRPKAGR